MPFSTACMKKSGWKVMSYLKVFAMPNGQTDTSWTPVITQILILFVRLSVFSAVYTRETPQNCLLQTIWSFCLFLTKVWRSHKGERRQSFLRQVVPQPFDMECPLFPEVFIQLYPLSLIQPLHFLEELPSNVDVSNWDIPCNAPGTKEAIHLQKNLFVASPKSSQLFILVSYIRDMCVYWVKVWCNG